MGGAHKVNPHRIRLISPGAQLPKPGKGDAGGGGIVYWINRDKRAQDNWALLHAAELSEAHAVPLSVVYCLEPPGPHATPREYSFRLKGLAEVQSDLDKLQVPFYHPAPRTLRALPLCSPLAEPKHDGRNVSVC
jgi:hypothetical protein